MKLQIAHASRPCAGETENGDAIVVRHDGDRTLVGVIDALGHGPRAAEAACLAVEMLRECPLDYGVRQLMTGVHERLRGSRGAAALLCILGPTRVEGCSVGNVELRTVRSKISAFSSPGVLGGRVRRFHVFEGEVQRSSRLVIFSDGISSSVPAESLRHRSPQETCDLLLSEYSKRHDDATVLAVDVHVV